MLQIAYRDDLGYVVEDVEDETVEFLDGITYFNDKQIETKYVVRIGEKES